MNDINLEELKQKFPESVFARRGLRMSRVGREWEALCPFHDDGKNPSWKLNRVADGTYLWHCWGCGRGGSVIDFIMMKDGCPLGEAIRKANEELGLVHFVDDETPSREMEFDVERSLAMLIEYEHTLAWAMEKIEGKEVTKGVSKDVAKALRFGLHKRRYFACGNHCPLCKEYWALVIPSFWNGDLVGLKYRNVEAPDSNHKWSQEPGSKQDFIWLADAELADPSSKVVLVTEGPLDAALLRSYGFNAVAVHSASAVPEKGRETPRFRQSIALLEEKYNRIVLIGDMDEAGVEAMVRLHLFLGGGKARWGLLLGNWATYLVNVGEDLGLDTLKDVGELFDAVGPKEFCMALALLVLAADPDSLPDKKPEEIIPELEELIPKMSNYTPPHRIMSAEEWEETRIAALGWHKSLAQIVKKGGSLQPKDREELAGALVDVAFELTKEETQAEPEQTKDEPAGAPAEAVVTVVAEPRPPTELGNAERLVDAFGEDIKYCSPQKKWYVWDGRHWAQDDRLRIVELMKQVVRGLYSEAAGEQGRELHIGVVKWAIKSEMKHVLYASIDLAQHMVAVRPDEFNRDIYLLNLNNGTLDLRSGALHAHRREGLIAKITPTSYDPKAAYPLWGKFLTEVLPDEASRKFVQRAVGYSLTGFAGEHCLFMPYGTGRNGKSTFLKTIQHVLGDYALQSDWQTFTISKSGGIQIRNDIARLQGARFVCAVEGEQNKRLAETLVKALTGGDRMTARFLYQEYVEFEPQCKFWLATNHKPKIVGTDEAIWSRIHLIPFTVFIPPDRRDAHLADKLKEEAAGILNWALDGLQDYFVNGLQPPEAVAEATADYRRESDALQHFLDDRCRVSQTGEVRAGQLYAAYKAWAEATGEYKMNERDFGTALLERGFKRVHREQGSVWLGILLGNPDGADRSDAIF